MTRVLVNSIVAEYRRYEALAKAALAQVPEAMLATPGPNGGNSIAVICWHVGGNLASRFTDFLTSDGEKPWRNRDEEFEGRSPDRATLVAQWDRGWRILFETLDGLTDQDLTRTVTIRRQPLAVHEALHRSLAHVAYHVGQIVYLAHGHVGADWKYLSIPPGQSVAYNANPGGETPAAAVERLRGRPGT